MKVVEKDKVIDGMLRDELKRCQEMLKGLERSVSELPKGTLFSMDFPFLCLIVVLY